MSFLHKARFTSVDVFIFDFRIHKTSLLSGFNLPQYSMVRDGLQERKLVTEEIV